MRSPARRRAAHPFLFLVSTLGLAAWPAPASPPPAAAVQAGLAARVDPIFAEWDRRDTPGCALAVSQGGRIVFQRGYGMASLVYGVRITPETLFPVGSNSKQFTAMGIALLAEDGRLSLGDDVRKYLPELPDYGRPITIDHLIHHTSGLRDYQALRFLAGIPPAQIDPQQIFALIARQRHLNFLPGEKFAYSNSGYVLLRLIVERVSGQSLADFAAERIFKPLGMTHTRWTEDPTRVAPNLATTHQGDRTVGFHTTIPATMMGSGGIWTTVGDLALWDENFYHNRLGKRRPQLIEQVLTPGKLADGTAVPYAFGLFLDKYKGREIVWHAGLGPGHVADVVRFPAEHLAVFSLCNGIIDSRRLSRQVADVYLGETPAGPQKNGAEAPDLEPAPATPAAAVLAAYTGRYASDELGATYTLVLEGNRLHVRTTVQPNGELVYLGPDRFLLPTQWFTFHVDFFRDEKGEIAGYTLASDEVQGLRFVREP